MTELRAALFVDFDNMLSGLRDGAGEDAALRFAEAPAEWLAWLAQGARRRFLLRRCYMNPDGYLEHADGARTYFRAFRYGLLAAGFEVVDCPRLTKLKNAADVRIALDAMDALGSATRYDEFTLMSSDADFVPLLLRLRAADRRTRLVAHPELGAIVRAVADEVAGLDQLARALGWGGPPRDDPDPAPDVLSVVQDIMASSGGPMHLPQLGALVRARTGVSLRDTNYGGLGSLEALLEQAGLEREEGPGGGYVVPAGTGSASIA